MTTTASLLDEELQTSTSSCGDEDDTGSSAEWESLCQAESQLNAVELEERNRALRRQLAEMIQRRRRGRQIGDAALLEELEQQRSAVAHERELLLQTLLAARHERRAAQERWQRVQGWNVLANDAFHIDVDDSGDCATINQLRLGAVAVVAAEPAATAAVASPVSTTIANDPNTSSSGGGGGGVVGGFFSFVGGVGGGGGAPASPTKQQLSAGTATASTALTKSKTVRVPWREINAALGQLALLLSVLEQSLAVPPSLDPSASNNIKQPPPLFRYELQVMGSTSKIGLRRPNNAATSFYNLYFVDEGVFQQLFGKRNFNTALQYLVNCVRSAATVLQQQQRRSSSGGGIQVVVLPHEMVEDKNGTVTVGGLSVQYFSTTTATGTAGTNTEEEHLAEWTRAMKYLLTNVKHLMVHRGIGLWSTT